MALKNITNIYNVSVSSDSIPTIEGNKNVPRTVLQFSSSDRNSGKIVYSNYPEFIGPTKGLCLAEYSYCPNRQQVSAGDNQVFFSHHNQTNEDLWYGVQIFNPNTTAVNFTLKNWGFGKTFDNTIPPVQNFLNTTPEDPISIPVNGVHWVLNQKIEASSPYKPFYGIVRFNVNKPVIVTCYAYKNISAITGNEVVHPYSLDYADDLKVYSGYGNGFILSKTINLDIDELEERDLWYYTGERDTYGLNTGELTSIYLAGENKIAQPNSTDPNLREVGNWTTQYDFTVNITNNTGVNRNVFGFISGNIKNSNPTIFANGNFRGWKDLGAQTRRWFKETITPGVSTFKFTYMQASYGAPATMHAWSLSENL